jgi:hypothetical protein
MVVLQYSEFVRQVKEMTTVSLSYQNRHLHCLRSRTLFLLADTTERGTMKKTDCIVIRFAIIGSTVENKNYV